MPYYNCPSCLLTVHARGIAPALTTCPRCLARRRMRVPLYETPGTEPPTLAARRAERDVFQPPAVAGDHAAA
jgi:hypothetical protein